MMPSNNSKNQYDAIFIRNALGEKNALPRVEYLTTSPDIISSGTSQAEDPSTEFGAASYDSNPSVEVVYGKDNYIYVRGKNYDSQMVIASASVYVSYTEQLSNPSSWRQLTTAQSQTAVSLGAAADGVAVTDTPFVFNMAQPSSGNPYVFIAVIYNSQNPNPVPDYIADHQRPEFDVWSSSLGGLAGAAQAVPKPPKTEATYQLAGKVNLGNDAAQKVSFSLEVDGGVAGDKVAFSAEENDVNNDPIGVGLAPIPQSDYTSGVSATVGADFSSVISFEYVAMNQDNLPHPTLTLMVTKIVDAGGGGDDGGNPFDPHHHNQHAVVIAKFVLTTSSGS